MKIDFEMLERMEAAGAPAKAIIMMLRTQFEREEAKKCVKRPKDKARKRERRAATSGGNVATPSDTERQEATVSDTPRARLFREGSEALVLLNIAPSRSRSLIGSWLKLTHDDEQLVLSTILQARNLAAADAPGWILPTLQKAMETKNGQRPGFDRTSSASGQSGSDAIFAGVGAAAERRARERAAAGSGGEIPRSSDPARSDDFELFGAGRG